VTTKTYVTLAALVPALLLFPQGRRRVSRLTRSGQSPGITPSRYLVGLGVAGGVPSQAAGEEPAKTSALADMSKQIVASISSTTTVEARVAPAAARSSPSRTNRRSKSAIKLPDAQIVARCFDRSRPPCTRSLPWTRQWHNSASAWP